MQNRNRWIGWLAVGLCVVLMGAGVALGKVSKREIDVLRAKNVLSDAEELALIGQFVSERFDDMLTASSASDVMRTKRDLLAAARSEVRKDVAAWQVYADTFAQAVKGKYAQVQAQAAELSDKAVAKSIATSTAVVVARTDSPLLIEDLLKLLESQAGEIRYWGAKGLRMEEVGAYLTNCNTDEVGKVLGGLRKAVVQEDNAVLVAEIAEAGLGMAGCEGGVELLQACASKRVAAYQKWTVRQESEDARIIRVLLAAIKDEALEDAKVPRASLIRSAGELFSAGHYRYIKGITYKQDEAGEVISLFPRDSEERLELQFLLIEGESLFHEACPERPTGKYYRSALHKENAESDLAKAYKKLLGPDGVVNTVFEIYPASAAQSPWEDLIGDPPPEFVEGAMNLETVRKQAIDLD